MADLEVEEDLDGDRYVARTPDRLDVGGAPTVVVHRLAWVDAAAWAGLLPVIAAAHRAGQAEEHLVAVLEAGHVDGVGAWCVTSDPGRARLDQRPIERPAALRAVARAASAAHALHEAGVLHLGISPAAVTPDGVLDLPRLDRTRTDDGHCLDVGPPTALDTIDPAVARGERPRRESDIYALGATLYRAVTGRLLHPDLASDAPMVALQRVMFEPVQVPGDVDPEVAATVAACTSLDPTSRPPSALALSRHLVSLVGSP